VLNNAVKIVNEIRSRPLYSRMKTLCESMDSQHERLLHAEDACQEGEFFRLFLGFKEETKQFLRERNSQLAEFILDVMWVRNLRIWPV